MPTVISTRNPGTANALALAQASAAPRSLSGRNEVMPRSGTGIQARPPRTASITGLLATLLFLGTAFSLHAQVAINSTGAAPGGNAILDVNSTSKGLLAPRMTNAQRLAIPQSGANFTAANYDGLLVYQTDSVGRDPRGYYYYDFTTPIQGWRHIAWGPKIWQLGGNAGTTASDFLGTTNNQPLLFYTDNEDIGRITPTGELQFYEPNTGPMSTTEQVQVQGALKLNGGSAGDNPGTIRFTPSTGPNVPAKYEGFVQNIGAGSPNGWQQIDNNFSVRQNQQSPMLGVGCADPTSFASVGQNPRPWPIPGPTTGFGSLSTYHSPYSGLWEDSHKQYLYRATDLAAAGICPNYPIQAIAFYVTNINSGNGRIHFLRFRIKNTTLNSVAGFDMGGLVDYAYPAPPSPGPGYPDNYTGYTVSSGWNIHPYDQGPPSTAPQWSGGGNLLIDASMDNQEWDISIGYVRYGSVRSYNSGYPSMVYNFCDACGGSGPGSCTWTTPPTTPTNGVPGPGGNVAGWGYSGGWTLTTQNTNLCDGTLPPWGGGGSPAILTSLPRVAFYCKYTGGGTPFNYDDYMVAQDGVMIGDAAWAAGGTYPGNRFHGPGTISAQKSIWSGTSLLSDYVFDLYYDGQAKPADAQGASQYVRTPLKELPNYVERNRHLPTIDGRATWNKTGAFSVDKLGNQLWVTVEDQALYIQELNDRMDALQQFLVEKKLKEIEGK